MKKEVYDRLAASGRYYNTGKVLIGLQYLPRKHYRMSRDEERIQSALLGHKLPFFQYDMTIYGLYLIGLVCLIAAIAKALS